MIQNVIFDLDGVLVDTEKYKARAHAMVVNSQIPNVAQDWWYEGAIGQPFNYVAKYFLEKSKAQLPIPEYKQAFNRYYRNYISQISSPTAGTKNLLLNLKKREYKLAVVTSSDRWMLQLLLTNTGIARYFDKTVCSEDVSKEKPDPEPYLKAMEKLKVIAAESIAVEDTPAGAQAAGTAGLKVIIVRHKFNRRLEFDNQAFQVDSLEEISVDMLSECQ